MKSTTEPTLYRSNVELYDIAFSWDIAHEIAWLLNRLGSHCRSILEPGCGSGRVLEAFAKKGIQIVGLDSSLEGITLAQKRLASLPNASALVADMTEFALGRTFDGAVCPINTLGILNPMELAKHLDCMSRHLKPNARYLVQVAIRENNKDHNQNKNGFEWEAERDDTHLRINVWVVQTDYQNMRELHGFKIIVETGKRAGEIIEEKHWMTMWTAESWQKVISKSQFQHVGQYDGDAPNWPSVPIGSAGNLMWHELIRR